MDIGKYSDAFDFYMDAGELPPDMAPSDEMGSYIKTFIDNNPRADGNDTAWTDIVKEGLMRYYGQILDEQDKIRRQTQRETDIIDEFEKASLDRKRQMWPTIVQAIKAKYSRYELDIDGFAAQFADNDRDAVFAAFISDWREASRRNADARISSVFTKSLKRFELGFSNVGHRDYEERRKIEELAYTMPQLREILEIIGREKDTADEIDNIIYTLLPQGAKTGQPSDDIDSIESGDNLHRVIPVEFAMPDDLFYGRYATKELQQLAPPRQRRPRKTEEHRPRLRPKKGPVIVGIDTSASMSGEPERIAKSLLIQLVKLARRQRRACYLITFSVHIRTMDLARSSSFLKLADFLNNHFTGGTDESRMVKEALRLLDTNDYEMADVLIISDFEFDSPRGEEIMAISAAKAKGTRFYGLQIHSRSKIFDRVLDRKWKV